jgi:UDP-glucuronate 4-epimerase
MKILVTGTAGFIGYHLAKKLIERGDEVVGLDCINDYYDINLKYGRLNECGIQKEDINYNSIIKSKKYTNYRFVKLNLEDKENLELLFKKETFEKVCNLAAQAGVRYSLLNPYAYLQSNITGFLNILECSRNYNIKNLVYASSSSVYGLNETYPLSTHHNVDHPISLYAASKKSNELMAHTYSYLFGIPTTGLRFFTVYGPWGRPDMALFIFTKAILNDQPIEVYNNGKMERDFTYIDDIIKGVLLTIDNPPLPNDKWSGKNPEPSSSKAPYKIYNIGNNNPVPLGDFIKAIENVTEKKAIRILKPMQPGDVVKTWADVKDLMNDFSYKPQTNINEGIRNFYEWYKTYYSQ